MNDAEEQLEDLKALAEGAVLLEEGGQPVALLPMFGFIAGEQPQRMDLLLIPGPHSGYVTRLFFAQKIDARGSNWKQHRVIERNWWAPSWNGVPATLPWRKMLLAHLRAVA